MTPNLARAAALQASSALAEPAQLRGICFDMDGTLCDSDSLHFQAYQETILRRVPEYNNNVPIEREWYNSWMSGNSNDVITARLFPDMPLAEQKSLHDEKEALYRSISTTLTPMPGLQQLLDWCDTNNIATIIVTNAPRLDAEHTMAVLGIRERFAETIVIGYECSASKPHPEPYLEGLRRLQLPADACIAFEDSANGCRSAVGAGLFTVGVATSLQEQVLHASGAGLAVTDFADERLWALLQRAVGTAAPAAVANGTT